MSILTTHPRISASTWGNTVKLSEPGIDSLAVAIVLSANPNVYIFIITKSYLQYAPKTATGLLASMSGGKVGSPS